MTRRQQSIDIALAWLALALAYRLAMQARLAATFLWADAWQDALLALVMTALTAAVARIAPRVALLVALVLLLVVGLEAHVFGHVLLAMRLTVDRAMLRDALQSDDWQVLQTAAPSDWLAVLAPLVLLLGLRTLPFGRDRLRPALLLALTATLILSWTWAGPLPPDFPPLAARNPMVQLVLDAPPPVDEALEPAPAPTATTLPEPATPSAPVLAPTPVALPAPVTQPFNVVWIVMESTGTRYFRGDVHADPPPMPTLQRLAHEGWYLSRHQSPSNSSATSIVSQFSGLYPSPETQMFATRADNWLPALPAFLPANYTRFLVTPGRLNFFFPQAFLRHAGLTDMTGYDEAPAARNVGVERMSKDEVATVTAFLGRLQQAQEPYLAVYYSFSPHWPYTDYGAAWRRYPGKQPLDQYHNALWLLDQQIARIVEQLRASGQLERTILVLAGDHGEAFGQHAHNWAHARGSYQENFETPAVLWQPRLFAPRVVTTPTSHIDLLPTVLDALHVDFDRASLQGLSLWQDVPARNLYAWSNEGMATVTTPAGVKLSWSVADGRCRVFELAQDPGERRALRCDGYGDLWADLRAWRAAQVGIVRARSEAGRAGK